MSNRFFGIKNIYDNIFIRYYVLKKDIDDYLSETFKKESREDGLVSAIVITAIAGLAIVGAIKSWFSGDSFTAGIVRGIGSVFYAISNQLAILSAEIFGYALAYLKEPITGGASPFIPSWVTTRDLANMAVVLGFVIIGIAFALRIEQYGSKKILAKLIIVALLINFSPLLCGLIIDASNILSDSAEVTSSVTMASSIVGHIEKSAYGTQTQAWVEPKAFVLGGTEGGVIDEPGHWEAVSLTTGELQKEEYKNDAVKAAGVMSGYALMFLSVAGTFFYLSIILVQRYVFLGIYFILAPLAFVCWALPDFNKYWKSWWEGLIKWAFIGLAASFLVMLGYGIVSDGDFDLKKLFVAVVFFGASFHFAKKYSGNVGTMAFGLATGAAGFAMGATSKLAKGGGKVLDQRLLGGRGAAAAQKISSWGGRLAERTGLKATGTTATANAKEVESQASTMAKEYAAAKATGNTATIDRIQKLARKEKGARGAAAMKVISDAKDLGDTFKDAKGNVETGKMVDRISYAEAAGATGIREKAEKLDPRLLARNKIAVKKAGGSADLAVEQGFAKANIAEIREYSQDVVKDKGFMNGILLRNPKKLGKAAEDMPQKTIDTIRDEYLARYDASGRSLPLANQPAKVQDMINARDAHPVGSSDWNRANKHLIEAQTELNNNPYFL